MPEKNVEYYLQLPYTRRVEPREDAGGRYFLAWIEELPSIEIHGDTRESALERLRHIMGDCIRVMIDTGDDIPEPVRWPEGLFGKDAVRNLKRIRRQGGREATVQVASTSRDERADGVEPWTKSVAGGELVTT